MINRCHYGHKTGLNYVEEVVFTPRKTKVGEWCTSEKGPKQRRSHHLPAFANNLLNEEKSNTEILITCLHLLFC